MSIAQFLEKSWSANWHEDAEAFLNEFIVTRYGTRARAAIALRCPYFPSEKGVAFAGVLHKDSPSSGGYGGTSFVIFPSATGAALVALGVGTQGLSPDEAIITRPGHARLVKAFASWLRTEPTLATAWAKTDPTRIDVSIPQEVSVKYMQHESVLKRYGDVLYLIFNAQGVPSAELERSFVGLFDLYMQARGLPSLAKFHTDANELRSKYEGRVLKGISLVEVQSLLMERRFVIIQGPPGTGKTRLASSLIDSQFAGRGRVIQFHPAIGYEQFVGGLAPVEHDGAFGFEAIPGHLLAAAKEAANSEAPYLLVIDEINRADLARTLGEAIYLFEPSQPNRVVELSYDFGHPWGRALKLPPNLYVLGTMNSADRSIAILDLAIRRRFAFVSLWPDASALESAPQLSKLAFAELRQIFMQEASDEQLELLPGHSYFFANSEDEAKRRIRSELVPLLRDYVKSGFVAGFVEEIEGFLQWLDAQTAQ